MGHEIEKEFFCLKHRHPYMLPCPSESVFEVYKIFFLNPEGQTLGLEVEILSFLRTK